VWLDGVLRTYAARPVELVDVAQGLFRANPAVLASAIREDDDVLRHTNSNIEASPARTSLPLRLMNEHLTKLWLTRRNLVPILPTIISKIYFTQQSAI
jgi:hypothetical protein